MPPRKNEKRRALKRGEALAMHPEAIRRDDRGAFFFMLGPSVAPNERVGDGDRIAVVNIRGALDQFDEYCGDSYESIVHRVREAMVGEDVAEGEAVDPDESDPMPGGSPHCVVLRLSSPGGVVAGLWECVSKLRAMSEEYSVPLVAYVDEMAASAAYAIACACESVYLPRSGVVGSIGVISHMFSIARANDEDGIDVEVIASGDQKADGNENLPISDDAKSREKRRVMKLARQFFSVVADARGVEAEGFQAGIFLGSDGVEAGLADDVMGWDAFLDEISLAYGGSKVTSSGVNGDPPRREAMTALLALIERTKQDLAKATGAKKKKLSDKLARLSASLSDLRAYKKTTKKMEETKEESEDDPEDKESEDDEKDKDAEDEESDDDAESEESDEDAESDDADEDAESDEKDEDAESDDKDKDKDAKDDEKDDKALLASIVDPKRRGQLAARLGEAKAGRRALKEVRKLAAERSREKRHALIDTKRAGEFITKAEAKWLKRQPPATVDSFLELRKRPILRTHESEYIPDDTGRPDASAHLSDQQMTFIRQAAAQTGVSVDKMVEDYKKGLGRPNGVKQ